LSAKIIDWTSSIGLALAVHFVMEDVMSKQYLMVDFVRKDKSWVIAQVDTDLEEYTFVVPNEWMQQYFGERWQDYEIEDFYEVDPANVAEGAYQDEISQGHVFEALPCDEEEDQ
jgi:hypothetical protein